MVATPANEETKEAGEEVQEEAQEELHDSFSPRRGGAAETVRFGIVG